MIISDPGRAAEGILVIKLGALGDFVQALGPMKAIRAHHLGAHIALLTTPPFAEMGRACGWFDAVWSDERPGLLALGKWLALGRRLRGAGLARVYDLQTSTRSSLYFRLFGRARRPQWSGIVSGCSHPHRNPDRVRTHTIERQAEQLALAGIGFVPPPDVSWMTADLASFDLAARFALLVPGGAPQRPEKRWPAEHYAQLAWRLQNMGIQPVLIGGEAERSLSAQIALACPHVRNLTGRTELAALAELARRAEVAVGNDTGPMHLTAAAGCPSVVLYSAASDPALCGQRGRAVTILRRNDLAALGVDEVAEAVASA